MQYQAKKFLSVVTRQLSQTLNQAWSELLGFDEQTRCAGIL